MYGRQKYRRLNRERPAESIPTFVCPRCGGIKSLNMPYTELSIIENGKSICYTKLCKECSDKITGDFVK